MSKAIVVDLDGTLTDCEHRVHHVQKEPKNWKGFNEGMGNDELNPWCHELIKAMTANGFKIIFLTGRTNTYRDVTTAWLKEKGVVYDELFMRDPKDRREDSEIKKDIFQNQIADHLDVLFIVEDRLSVVKMWRSIGVVCLQCDWGDF